MKNDVEFQSYAFSKIVAKLTNKTQQMKSHLKPDAPMMGIQNWPRKTEVTKQNDKKFVNSLQESKNSFVDGKSICATFPK